MMPAASLDPFLEFTAKADGLHTIRIYDQLRGGSTAHQYRIEVTTPPPSFALTLKELRRVETHVVPVPKWRQDWDGRDRNSQWLQRRNQFGA